MAYYRSDSGSGLGCLIWLAILGVIGLVAFCNKSTENSQRGIIKEARNASSEDSKASRYEAYLKIYPHGKYEAEASAYIVDYYSRMPTERTSSATSYSLKGLSRMVSAKEKFNGTQLEQRLDSIIQSRVDEEYSKASSEETLEGWQYYKNIVPPEYWRDANDRIEAINKTLWGTEGMAWKTAQGENTLAAYNKYLELYPHGAHSKVADKKVIDLSVSNIFSGEHGTLPGMDKTSYSSSGRNVISVKNDTQYTLTLLYSGTDSKRLVLSPRSSGTISLPNGTYRVAASVAAANVRSYAGTETLTGGGYDVSYYISTSRY